MNNLGLFTVSMFAAYIPAYAEFNISQGKALVATDSSSALAVVSISGESAKSLYNTMRDVSAQPVENVDRAQQKVGTRLICTKYTSESGKKFAYTCETTATTSGDFLN